MEDLDELGKSDVFCILPWIHLSVRTDGKIFPCCASHWGQPSGDLKVSTLAEVWNSETTRRMRLNMLEGKPSPACRQCYDLQNAHVHSSRENFNARFAHHLPKVGLTRPDGSLETMRMPYMDVRYSNVCNFRCRMCGPISSSAWFEDGTKLWGGIQHEKVLTPTNDPEELWRQIEPLLPDLEEIYFAGGEPLLMDEHYRILDFLLDKKLTDVRLLYSTNFSVLNHRDWDATALWKEFRSVHVAASLDGMGRRGEYLRAGMSWDQVRRNRERLAAACPRVEFRVAATLNIMNSLDLPDFHARLLETGFIEPGMFRFTMLATPEEYHIQALPPSLKRLAAEKFERHAERLLARYGAPAKDEANAFQSASAFIAAEDKTDRLPLFRERTERLDAIRGEKFSEVFPELAELTR